MSMLSPTVLQVLVPLSEAGGEGESGLVQALVIGLGTLAFLLALIFGVTAFGKGRDHS
jgi:hypothetical protein